MSDVFDQGQTPGQGAASHAGPSAGALIRRAREAAGVHIAALAVALKVPVRRLEALEADRYDLLPDAVFARALASSVCRSLKVDPSHILPLLPKSLAQPLTVEGHINEPFRSSQEASAGWKPRISRPAVVAGVALALAALAVYLWPALVDLFASEGALSPAQVQAPPLPGGAAPAAGALVIESVPSAASMQAPMPAAVPVAPPAPASR